MEQKHYTKRFMALLVLLLTTTGIMFAAPRSVEQARKVAVAQMQKHSARKSKAHGGTAMAVNPKLVLAKEKQTKGEVYYYVFSAGHDLGYTIVSGDDRLPEIVGYTESGNYDADKLPENLASFMQAYQNFADNATDGQIEEIKQWKAQAKHAAVEPLMEEKWDQGEPYNNMCPEYKYNSSSGVKSDRAVTGCTATAISQILHHYSCPDVLKEDIPEYTFTTTVNGYPNEITMPGISAGEQYDWHNMLNAYNGKGTQEQKDAIAKLMLHVGCAVKTTYGPSSGASASAETFTKYFGMDKELIRQVFRKDYNISQWDNMLYNELAAERPVFYDGQSTGGGHAFIVHGYNDGLYFVNWGWGGYCDGYFDITILNPHNTSSAGASSSNDGYSMNNSMIIGITPDNGKVDDVTNAVFTARTLTITSDFEVHNGTITAKANISVINFNPIENTRYVSVGYMDANGDIQNIATPKQITIQAAPPNGGYSQSATCSISFPYATGIYTLCLIESKDQNTWALCPQYNSFVPVYLQVKDNNASVITPSTSLTAYASLDNESSGYARMSNTINITVNNSGDKEYYDRVYVMVGTEETMPEGYTYSTGITAPASGSITFNFAYTPKTAETYNFWILDVYGKEIGNSSITFKETTAPVLSFVSIKCTNASDEKVYADFQGNKVEMNKVNDTKAEFTFEIKNDGGYYEGQFRLYEYNNAIDDSHWHWDGYEKTLKIPGNSTTTFKFTIEGDAGSTVGLWLQSAPGTAQIAGLTTPNKHEPYKFTDCEICYLAGSGSGINDIQADIEKEGAFYNLRGEKVNNPAKGIYIKNGKKYLLK